MRQCDAGRSIQWSLKLSRKQAQFILPEDSYQATGFFGGVNL